MHKGSFFGAVLRAGSAPAALAAALVLAGTASQAQTTTSPPASPAPATGPGQTTTDADVQNEVVVTGSRIVRANLQAATPVAVVGSADIQHQGATNVQEVLNRLPQVGIPGLSNTNSNFLTSGNGVSTINLRNLGDERTLVLVNGRRFVAGLAGTSIVDVNNIPADFIDRVEVVTGGASAVYGSDAISGVVNFILKDRFEGVTARAQYGLSSRGDNRKYTASLTAGTSFGADNRGSLYGNFTYDRDYGLWSRDRAISAQDCSRTGCGPAAYSTYSPQGRFQLYSGGAPTGNAGGFTSNLFTFNPDNSLVLGFPTGYGFNREAVRRISTPLERYIGNAVAKYELTDSIRAFVEGTYVHVKSSSAIEPFAMSSDTDLGFGYSIDNPFIPAAIQAQIAARNSDADPTNDVDQISFRRRQNEVFSRSNQNRRDTFRIAAGLNGKLGDWRWEVSYVYGQLKDHTWTQDLDLSKYAQALDAVRDGSGNIVCRDPAARTAGCVPINLFGYNTATSAASSYVQASVPREERAKNTEQVANANITGPIFALPAGDVQVSVGAEYRREKSVDNWDPLTNAGLNTGNQIPDTVGKFNVKEVFGELDIPLLRDKPFFQNLVARGAARYSDYSTVGNVFSWSAGGEWSPVRWFRVRGNYAVANRAPNISELYSPPAETFPSVSDPCEGVTATSSGANAQACRAIPAVAAGIQRNGGITYTLADIQGINGFDGGNPNLREEKGKTLTIGGVLTPPMLRGFSLTVDYFRIKIDNAIGTVDRQTSIDQCVTTGLPQFCSNVIRNPVTGLITTVNAQNINIARRSTSGIDTDLRYGHALGLRPNDRLDLNVLWTHTLNYKRQPDPSAPVQNGIGNLEYGEVFRDKIAGQLTYSAGPVSLTWGTTYLSHMTAYSPASASTQDLIDAGFDPVVASHNNIKARFYHDMQLDFNVGPKDRFRFFLGVNNVFDRKPPKLEDTAFPDGVTITGTTTAADVYDPFGRRFYAGVQVHF